MDDRMLHCVERTDARFCAIVGTAGLTLPKVCFWLKSLGSET
jgi:hypothetical protein